MGFISIFFPTIQWWLAHASCIPIVHECSNMPFSIVLILTWGLWLIYLCSSPFHKSSWVTTLWPQMHLHLRRNTTRLLEHNFQSFPKIFNILFFSLNDLYILVITMSFRGSIVKIPWSYPQESARALAPWSTGWSWRLCGGTPAGDLSGFFLGCFNGRSPGS